MSYNKLEENTSVKQNKCAIGFVCFFVIVFVLYSIFIFHLLLLLSFLDYFQSSYDYHHIGIMTVNVFIYCVRFSDNLRQD